MTELVPRLAVLAMSVMIGCESSSLPPDAASPAPPREPRWVDGAFRATNEAQGFSARIDSGGAWLTGANRAWATTIRALSIGRASKRSTLDAPRAVSASHQRVELERAGLTEWYAHDGSGLEQGIEVERAPPGDGDLEIVIAVEGLTPTLRGSVVDLRSQGQTLLTYGDLAVNDADGRSIGAELSVEGAQIVLRIRDRGARYPLAVDPLIWGTRQTKLVALDGAARDGFGAGVGLGGSTAIVGAYSKTVGSNAYQGAAYVFERSGTGWTEEAQLVAADGASNDAFGLSVAIDGSVAIVGAIGADAGAGAAYVFVRTGTTWTEEARLVAADPAPDDNFGIAVSIDGSTAIVGAHKKSVGGELLRGAAYVFVRSGTSWSQQAMLTGGSKAFGSSVSLRGDTALVGAPHPDTAGSAHVFSRSGSTWSREATLVPAESDPGDGFGASVALFGDTALIGAPHATVAGQSLRGAAYVFARSDTTWTERARLLAADGGAYDELGSSVALRGSTALVGASQKSFGASRKQGAAYVFGQTGALWSQQAELVASDGAGGDSLGTAVALGDDGALVSADQKTIGSDVFQGVAYVFAATHSLGDGCPGGADDCTSGFCVDGVCCDSACTGTCRACTAAKMGGETDGTCGLVTASTDPDGECPTTCAGSTLSIAHGCAGDSAACATPSGSSCAPYACAASECKTSCVADSDCDAGGWCSAGICKPASALGVACTTASECLSRFCVDGVCCDAQCTGACRSCRLAATGAPEGTCASIAEGTDPDRECPATICTKGALSKFACDGAGACGERITACVHGCTSAGTSCANSVSPPLTCVGCDPTPSQPTTESGGCGCETVARSPGTPWLCVAFALAGMRRRRRSRPCD